jgi:hypothetical protein
MSQETYVKPGKQSRELRKRAQQAKVNAGRVSPRELLAAKRKQREKKAQALASQLLPDGTTPKLRASLMAAQRRHDNDPKVQATLERVKMSKRVQMAKEHSGLSKRGEPPRFLGMDAVELEREIANVLPPSMSEIRAGKGKVKKP